MCTSWDRALPLFVRPHSFWAQWAAFLCRVGCVSSLQVDTGANQPSCRIYLTNFRMTDCIWVCTLQIQSNNVYYTYEKVFYPVVILHGFENYQFILELCGGLETEAYISNTMHAVNLSPNVLWKAHPVLSSDVIHMRVWPAEHIFCLFKMANMIYGSQREVRD